MFLWLHAMNNVAKRQIISDKTRLFGAISHLSVGWPVVKLWWPDPCEFVQLSAITRSVILLCTAVLWTLWKHMKMEKVPSRGESNVVVDSVFLSLFLLRV